jgi:DNA repair protein RadA/Sms
MAKVRSNFVCQNCGALSQRWLGKCEACNGWNCIVEEQVGSGIGAQAARGARKGRVFPLEGLTGETKSPPRIVSGLGELDRVTGGGFVPGSVILLGGEPGIGKSTLLIQACATLARKGHRVAYISGEEAVAQVRLRAERLGLADAPIRLAAATSVRDILTTLGSIETPALLVIDSIQTMYSDQVEGAPGTVSQVRASAFELIRWTKERDTALVLVGHVTKDGAIAGPRVLEHMVDVVMSFEGERSHQYRILRNLKNRFGPVDEIGVFAMEGQGLIEVANPSLLFLSGREEAVAGSAVFPAVEGTRPVLIEIQALIVRLQSGATPRRAVVGWDSGRLAMLLAVLEARCGLNFSSAEVYLNVAGGYRLSDPAADLAVAAALVSALADRALPARAVWFGEVSLAGEVRQVAHAGLRLREAAKLGFTLGHGPVEPDAAEGGMTCREVRMLPNLVDRIMPDE